MRKSYDVLVEGLNGTSRITADVSPGYAEGARQRLLRNGHTKVWIKPHTALTRGKP